MRPCQEFSKYLLNDLHFKFAASALKPDLFRLPVWGRTISERGDVRRVLWANPEPLKFKNSAALGQS